MSHDDPHYHPSPNVTETRTASLAVKSAPDAEGYWWARWLAAHERGHWETVRVLSGPEGMFACVPGIGEPVALLHFDAWVGPLSPPAVTP